jgi:methyl-accepting chemotaxis protein
MQFDNLRVSTKLWGAFLGLLLMALAGAAVVQIRSLAALNASLESVIDIQSRISTAIRWRGVTETAVTMVIGAGITTDSVLAQVYTNKVKDSVAAVNGLQAEVQKGAATPSEKDAVQRILEERKLALASIPRVAAIKASGDSAAVQAFVSNELNPAVERYLKAQDAYVAGLDKEREGIRAEVQVVRMRYVLTSFAVYGAVAMLGMLLSWRLVRSITAPLAQAAGLADAIAEGDLTRTVDSDRQDELGHMLRSLSAMGSRLRTIVEEVRSGVDAVSSASIEIANGNQDLSARTEQTASHLEETAASMEQLTATVSQAADTARQADLLASTAARSAEHGGNVVGQVVQSMQKITDSSHRIADIIGVIDSIAFQTNILALNAAVEAARAGEQGRGFAVVASEVRSLAQRSASAAKDIKHLIDSSVDSVAAGSAQVAQAGQSMDEIVASVRRVSDLIGEITASSSEQRDGISQVNHAVTHLDQMTQQNAALVEESAAATASMRDKAQRLANVVSVFQVGPSSTRPSHPPPNVEPGALPCPSNPLVPY